MRNREKPATTEPEVWHQKLGTFLVGRDEELAQLERYWAKALEGARQIIFLSGEPGIGKTALIDAFVEGLRDHSDVLIAHGQCVEQYGAGEAYLPLLEATTQLCRGPHREQCILAMKQYAPSWLMQLPGLLTPEKRVSLAQRMQGTNRERMLREMAEAAEQFTRQRRLVVVLEDLHWSDVSTLDWLTYMARRREPAKLMILGTYRPADVLASNHPLRAVVQELQARQQCEEIYLHPLGADAITAYLTKRFGKLADVDALTATLVRRTGGNPLFLVTTVDYLVEQEMVANESGSWTMPADKLQEVSGNIPDTLRQLIEQQVERLSEEDQRALEVASVVGMEFSVAEVAAGLSGDVEALESQCEHLAHTRQLLRTERIDEWPDGTLSGCYSFLHAVYQEVISARVDGARRIQLHQRIAERKETAYGDRAPEIAAELAVHFEHGREYAKAGQYHEKAGHHAMQQNAAHEAISHFTKSLSLLEYLPKSLERTQQELALHVALGPAFIAAKGNATPEVERTYVRARELCRVVGESSQIFPTLLGLRSVYLVRGELQTAHALSEELFTLAGNRNDPALLLEASMALGNTSFLLGDLSASLAHHDQAVLLYDSQQHHEHRTLYGLDPAAFCLSRTGWTLWLLGYPDQAEMRLRAALELAEKLAHPFSIVVVLLGVASVHLVRQDGPAAQAAAERAIALTSEHGFLALEAQAAIYRGQALAEQGHLTEGIEQIRQAIVAWRATGAQLFYPYSLALLAEAYQQIGQAQNGLEVLTEAFATVQKTEERFYEAELYRLRGELTLATSGARSPVSEVTTSPESRGHSLESENPSLQPLAPSTQAAAEAEACFLKAIDIARQQHAKSLELRAVMSLVRLRQHQAQDHAPRTPHPATGDQLAEACTLLQEVYNWFTEGFDTKDVQEAAALLVMLGGTVDRMEEKRQTSRGADEGESGQQEDNNLIAPSFSQPQSLASSLPQSSALSPQHSSVFRSEGEYWTVVFQGTTARIKDTRGMQYLAHLLQHPDQEISALALAADTPDFNTPPLSVASLTGENRDPALATVHVSGLTDAGEMLDPQAKAEYRQRLKEIQAELEEARTFNDGSRIERLQDELEFVTQELVGAVGLRGRARKAASPQERARVNITRAIRTAITRVVEVNPALGQYLSQTIKTGTFCVYVPTPHTSVTWEF